MSHPSLTIGVVGVGAMGGAFAAGLSSHATVVVEDALPGRADQVSARLGVQAGNAAACDVVVLAVKPQDLAATADAIASRLADGSTVVSVAAGWPLERLIAALPGHPMVRLMPNLAVANGNGVIAVATAGLDEVGVSGVCELLRPLGAVVVLDETLFGIATAIGGSGPGFLAYVAAAMENAGVANGMQRDDARAMVQGVLAGTAGLLADHGDPAVLQARVTSPGGTTAACIAVMDDSGGAAMISRAIEAAMHRANEL